MVLSAWAGKFKSFFSLSRASWTRRKVMGASLRRGNRMLIV
jgi:hypothetical protein